MNLAHADHVVECPVDGLSFKPRYTDGRCPLCGWTPGIEDAERPPRLARIDWFWVAMVVAVLASIAMSVVVVRSL